MGRQSARRRQESFFLFFGKLPSLGRKAETDRKGRRTEQGMTWRMVQLVGNRTVDSLVRTFARWLGHHSVNLLFNAPHCLMPSWYLHYWTDIVLPTLFFLSSHSSHHLSLLYNCLLKSLSQTPVIKPCLKWERMSFRVIPPPPLNELRGWFEVQRLVNSRGVQHLQTDGEIWLLPKDICHGCTTWWAFNKATKKGTARSCAAGDNTNYWQLHWDVLSWRGNLNSAFGDIKQSGFWVLMNHWQQLDKALDHMFPSYTCVQICTFVAHVVRICSKEGSPVRCVQEQKTSYSMLHTS